MKQVILPERLASLMPQDGVDAFASGAEIAARRAGLVMTPPRSGMSVMANTQHLVAHTVALGVLGERWLNEPKAGVRKPISPIIKTKARRAAKAAAKSRRRNRQ